MSYGSENIYSARWCRFCDCSLAPSVANLHGLASRDRRLDSANVGKLDCSRRSGWLELLRIKPHAAWPMTKPTKEQKFDCIARTRRTLAFALLRLGNAP